MQTRILAVIFLVCAVAASGCHKTSQARPLSPEEHFSMMIEHSPTGWAAHCERGCSWKDATMQCGHCKVRIDANGIYDSNTAARSQGFAFVLDDNNGLSAHGVRGTRWVDLSWGCAGVVVCRSRISDEGVHVAG